MHDGNASCVQENEPQSDPEWDKQFKCPETTCSFSSKYQPNVNRHYEQQHMDRSEPRDRQVSSGRSDQKSADPAAADQSDEIKVFASGVFPKKGKTLIIRDRSEFLPAPFRQTTVDGRKSYKCLYCGHLVQSGLIGIETHVNLHEGTKWFRCVSCDYVSTTFHTVVKHVREKHESDKQPAKA